MKKILFINLNILLLGMCIFFLHKKDIHILKISDLDFSIYTDVNYNRKTSKKKINKNYILDSKEIKTSKASVKVVEPVVNNVVSPVISTISTPVLETQVGTMSAYGPNCVGCSGHLGGGFDASGGNHIYQDPTYGNVRIVAGDSKYPYGTIVKVSNSKLGVFNAIVLDRGGAIGIGKRFMFDLLFPSEEEAASFGTSYNVVFDILRYGY